MSKHGKASRKRIVKRVKQAVANERLRSRVEIARDKKARAARGDKDAAKHKITPGIKAQVRNLDVHGERMPVRTRGKIDKGGPIKRTAVAFQKLRTKETARVTAKKQEANKKRHEKADFKDKITKIHQLKNDRFRREQEKKAMGRRADARSGRKR
jgi:hypothetical protein